jgi:hypothetical protein
MIESIAVNKKCPYQFNTELHEFSYCITTDCLAWVKENDQEGHCQRLANKQCQSDHYSK